MEAEKTNQSIFTDLKSAQQATVMQSVCTSCFQSGQTRILLTKIPFFREIMLTSFSCDNCGNKNNQVQFAGQLPDFGVDILFRVMSKQDINREIIKSQFAKIYIPQLDLQIPESKKAEITTVEGLLMRIHQELSIGQQARKLQNTEQYNQIQQFLAKLKQFEKGERIPMTIKITDPSGNSNIKNPFAPKQDKNLQITYINRTLQDLTKMGYSIQNAKQQMKDIQIKKLGNKMNFSKPFQQTQFMKFQPVIFDVPCHSCQIPGQMKMCTVSVPYFTDLCIMSFVCDYCGAHSTQTKNAGQIKDQGCRIILNCQNEDDLKRDLFKSQTCAVDFPQIQLQLDYGTLGGVYTTVEGLLEKIHDHLSDKNPFTDSDQEFHSRMTALLSKIEQMRNGQRKFKLILRDPLGHSFLQNPYHPDQDPRAERILYKRTQQQQDFLGIADMKVEGYQEHAQKMTKQDHKVLIQQCHQDKLQSEK